MSMGRNWSSLAWMAWMTTAKIPSTEQDGVFNVMSMGRNWSSLAWMTNIMSMGRNWSSLAWMAWMTTAKIPPPNKMVYLTLCLWEEIGLVWPGRLLLLQTNWSCLAWIDNFKNSLHRTRWCI
jgi:hypothetical protein